MKKIICVCTHDLTRGPTLASILRTKLAKENLSAHVYSAGIDSNKNKGSDRVPKRLREMLEDKGYGNLVNHSPTQITYSLIDESGLVLTTSRNQREKLKNMFEGKYKDKIFTLPEYATNGKDINVDIFHPTQFFLNTKQTEDNPIRYISIARVASKLPYFLSSMYLHFVTDGMIDSSNKRARNRLYSHLIRDIERYASISLPRLVEEGFTLRKK